jgi:ectoine hydroxylase-related dioxygenase (phytanoyl-CoA dioxygenase family)
MERLPYWHRDMQFSPIADKLQQAEQANILALHIRIPMIKEKGVELIPGTHQRWDTELEGNVRFEINGHSNHEQLPDAELIDLKPGDILIFNGQMIHRGNYQLNAKRKALDLCVSKNHSLTNQFLDKSVLPSDDEMRLLNNSEWFELANKFIKENNES